MDDVYDEAHNGTVVEVEASPPTEVKASSPLLEADDETAMEEETTLAVAAEEVEREDIVPVKEFFPSCRHIDVYEKLNKISEGTFGAVYRARDRETGRIVALKKIKMEREKEGFPITALREVSVLMRLKHRHIIDVVEIVMGYSLDDIFMVMEFMQHDLRSLVEQMRSPFLQSEVKCLMLQLLSAVAFVHENYVLHRDLKTSNILFNNEGVLKVCDFGLARSYGSPLRPYSPMVVTLWYRAPELLFGSNMYSEAVDMWSVGCIFAELVLKDILFDGRVEIDQIRKIMAILGKPNDKIWPGFSQLPNVEQPSIKAVLQKAPKFSTLAQKMGGKISAKGIDLLAKMLAYDPAKRISAKDALQHEFFREAPFPQDAAFMPTFPSQAEGAPRPRGKRSLEEEINQARDQAAARAAELRYAKNYRERNYQ